MSKQTEAVGMLKIMDWWRSVMRRMDAISREEASVEPTDEYISETMKELIDEITPLIPEGGDSVTTTIRYEHASGKTLTFEFTARIEGEA